MIKKSTWILLAVFLLLLLVAAGWQFGFKPKSEPTATPTVFVNPLVTLFPNLTSTMVAGVTIQSTEGQVMELGRDDAGLWTVVQPEGGATDSTVADSLVSTIVRLTATNIVNPKDDLSVYGLSQPAYVVDVHLNGGDTHTIRIGDLAINGQYYVQVDGGQPATVDQFSVSSIIDSLTNPPFQPTPTPEITPTVEPAVTGTAVP